MRKELRITTLQHNTEAYQQMLQLRTTVLLQPIGVDPSFIKPEQEKGDVLIGAFEEDTLIGCCVLTPKNKHTIQLRQMAVATTFQGRGIGAAILEFAEKLAKENQFQTLMLHARSPVVPFYMKSGYAIAGELFEEVGIPHYRMEKHYNLTYKTKGNNFFKTSYTFSVTVQRAHKKKNLHTW